MRRAMRLTRQERKLARILKHWRHNECLSKARDPLDCGNEGGKCMFNEQGDISFVMHLMMNDEICR